MFFAKERAWLTADSKTLVKDGDPKAAFLFATSKGQRIDDKKVAGITNLLEFVTDSNAEAAAAQESTIEKRVTERLEEQEKAKARK